MRRPIQAPPVQRHGSGLTPLSGTVSQSGCCVRVAGICLASSPIC